MFTLRLRSSSGREYEVHPGTDIPAEGEITESSTVRFILSGDIGDPYRARLKVEDVQLDSMPRAQDEVHWLWPIDFNAGLARVVLELSNGRRVSLHVRTDPACEKLTRHDYITMVGDILGDTLALLALSGHREGVRRGEVEPPGIARLELLAASLEAIEGAVRQVDRAPWTIVERERRWIPTGRSQRVTTRMLQRSLRRLRPVMPDDDSSLSAVAHELSRRLNGHLPTAIECQRPEPDNRRREHSEMLGALGRWRKHLLEWDLALQRLPTPSDAHLAQATRCRQMRRRLESLESLPVFDEVEPSIQPPGPSHLYRHVGPYRRFIQAWRRASAGLARVQGDFLDLPLRRTFDLYEQWVFLRMLRAAGNRADAGDRWKKGFQDHARAGGLVLSLRGRPFQFGRWSFLFKPRYSEVWREPAAPGERVGSFSRPMEPDIALEVEQDAGAPLPTIVLDAKYRVDAQLDDAITSIHTYRDALVYASSADSLADSQRTVKAGFVITPALPHGKPADDWRHDGTPHVFFRDGYRDTFSFGVVSLRPGASLEQTAAVLDIIVEQTV